jgi:hypothetical protein
MGQERDGTGRSGCLKGQRQRAPEFVSPRWGSRENKKNPFALEKDLASHDQARSAFLSAADALRGRRARNLINDGGHACGGSRRESRTRCRGAAPAVAPGVSSGIVLSSGEASRVVRLRSAPTSRAISLTLAGSAISSAAAGRGTAPTEMDFFRLWSTET